jgi:hypothetical protein
MNYGLKNKLCSDSKTVNHNYEQILWRKQKWQKFGRIAKYKDFI